jgi:type I restriction enzyme, S subunit
MTNWKTVKFGDVVRHVKDRVKDVENCDLTEYTRGEHFEPGNLHLIGRSQLGDGLHGSAFHMRFRPGDVLYVSRNPQLRKVAVADYEGICANTSYVLRADGENLIQELLPFIMQTEDFVEYTIRHKRGSTNFYLNYSDISPYKFPLPPIDEQRRIAELLWAADDNVQAYEKLVHQSRLLKTSWFEEWVSMNCNKESISKLGEAIVDIVAGKSPKNSGRPAEDNEYGVLKVSAIGELDFVESENKVLLQDEDFISDLEVQAGFLLVTRANALLSGIGRVCFVKNTRPKLMLSDKTLRLVVNYSKATDRFLLQALRSKIYRDYVEKVASGTGAKNISQAKLKKASIPLPSVEKQKEVEEVLFKFDSAIENAEKRLEQANSLKKLLLNSNLG